MLQLSLNQDEDLTAPLNALHILQLGPVLLLEGKLSDDTETYAIT